MWWSLRHAPHLQRKPRKPSPPSPVLPTRRGKVDGTDADLLLVMRGDPTQRAHEHVLARLVDALEQVGRGEEQGPRNMGRLL